MVYPLFSVKDDLTGYGIPFASDNDATAMRAFNQFIEQPNSLMGMNKSQFNLYHVGEFDTESGTIVGFTTRYVCSALDFDKE